MKKIPWALRDDANGFLLLRAQDSSLNGPVVKQQFYELVKNTGHSQHYRHAHEWCCGSGAIGFHLLHSGLCDRLTLSDISELDLLGCAYTAAANDIQSSVNIYQIERIADLPIDERWDLVIANPPWRSYVPEVPWGKLTQEEIRTMVDPDWIVHNQMWQDITAYLAGDVDLYFYEDLNFSNDQTWKDQIQASGLRIHDVYHNFGPFKSSYVIHLVRA